MTNFTKTYCPSKLEVGIFLQFCSLQFQRKCVTMQAVQDGVDVLSISLGSTSGTYGVPSLNTFDIALLFAVKAGVVVVHAAGNNGPYPLSMNSFGPWVISVASGMTDRSYSNPIILGSGQRFSGLGLSGESNDLGRSLSTRVCI
jgi:subtilisin family serine protease